VRFTDALRAADNQLTVRDTARGVAARHGLLASFAPKPFADQAGNGSHIHWSL
jgi:glutamine synthetase